MQAILLDVEGTTTPIAFVHQTLFSYARTHAKEFLSQHFSSAEVQADLGALAAENAANRRQGLDPPVLSWESPEAELESFVAYIHWLMNLDRKPTPLKSLQGKIWEQGYRRGELRSQVFPDVPAAFERWRKQGKHIGIFSSGSALAQKLLFAHTESGDLTRFISVYFDTTTGAKTASESYRRIAASWQRAPGQVVFVSDVVAELDAARTAGLQTNLSLRPGNSPQPAGHTHPRVQSFDELFPEG